MCKLQPQLGNSVSFNFCTQLLDLHSAWNTALPLYKDASVCSLTTNTYTPRLLHLLFFDRLLIPDLPPAAPGPACSLPGPLASPGKATFKFFQVLPLKPIVTCLVSFLCSNYTVFIPWFDIYIEKCNYSIPKGGNNRLMIFEEEKNQLQDVLRLKLSEECS